MTTICVPGTLLLLLLLPLEPVAAPHGDKNGRCGAHEGLGWRHMLIVSGGHLSVQVFICRLVDLTRGG